MPASPAFPRAPVHPFTRLEICAEAVRMGLFPVPSEVAIRQINRKIVLSGLSALAATGALPLSAQGRQRSFGFSFSIDGQRFCAVVTARSGEANLVTIRTFDRRIRAAVMVPIHQSQARSVPLADGGRRAVVSIVEQGPAMQGAGVRLLGVSQHPSQGGGQLQTQGLLTDIFNAVGGTIGAIGDMLEVFAVGLAAGSLHGWWGPGSRPPSGADAVRS
jgi:hypothetical protein